MAQSLAVPPASKKEVQPFSAGSRRFIIPIGQMLFAVGTRSFIKVPKTGYATKYMLRFNGTVTVGTAGAATTPRIENLIATYIQSANFGYQRRNLNGNSLKFWTNLQRRTISSFEGSNVFSNYNPASATAQTVQCIWQDSVAENQGLNFDRFLVSALTLDTDEIIDVTFGQLNDIKGDGATEVLTSITGTVFISGEYQSVPRDTDEVEYEEPDTTLIQQVIDDSSFTPIVAGADNVIHITPLQGPRYQYLAFRVVLNALPDPYLAATTQVVNVRLKANGYEDLFIWEQGILAQRNFDHFGRSLGDGWYLLDFNDDVGLVNASGQLMREVMATMSYATLDLIVTIKSGANVANSSIKVFKRTFADAKAA